MIGLKALEVANDCYDESYFPCVSRNVTSARNSQTACAVLRRRTDGMAADGNLWPRFELRIFLIVSRTKKPRPMAVGRDFSGRFWGVPLRTAPGDNIIDSQFGNISTERP